MVELAGELKAAPHRVQVRAAWRLSRWHRKSIRGTDCSTLMLNRCVQGRAAIGSVVGLGIGIAAAVVAVALIVTSASQPAAAPARAPARPPAAAHRTSTPLLRLAGYIKTHTGQPAGNATLIIRTEPNAKGHPDRGADLFTDSGAYYWAPTESGLPAQIAAHHDLGNGMFRREVAAALYAVNGNLAIARQRMINAPLDPLVLPVRGSLVQMPAPPITTSGRTRSTRSRPALATPRSGLACCASCPRC